MDFLLIGLILLYLLTGFVYAVYIVMVRSGSLFSIPINTILGPLFFFVNYYNAYKSIKRKGRPSLKEYPVEEKK